MSAKYDRLDQFITARYADIYPETMDDGHRDVTAAAIAQIVEMSSSIYGWRVLDVGCGRGVALEMFNQRGADATGICFGSDLARCLEKGLSAEAMDMSFLEYDPEMFDLVFARHVLEHSLFPYFTVTELARVLKSKGMLYAEVPAPDTSARHQNNPNHYSCLTLSSWNSLFYRVGLELISAYELPRQLACGPDVWYSFFLRKP